jgi:gas vesicle protein
MRFVFGVVIGFAIGFAGAILLAPEKKERQWTPRSHADGKPGENGLVDTLRERVREAMGEAREAKKQAERDMLDRYERSVGRRDGED